MSINKQQKHTSVVAALLAGMLVAGPLAAQDKPAEAPKPDPAATLEQLLNKVRASKGQETAANKAREARFLAARNQQRRLLDEAQGELQRTEQRSDQLKASYDENERKLEEMSTLLNERQGALGEMFGIVRLVAGDVRGVVEGSLVSAQIPGRETFLSELAQAKELPTTPALEQLWLEIMQEMVESGKVRRFDAEVVLPDGRSEKRSVVRVGVFNAVSDGKFLNMRDGQLVELKGQPPSRYTDTASDLESAKKGPVRMTLDPTRGPLLAVLVDEPTLWEHLKQGKEVGYVIMILGVFGLIIVIWRFLALQGISGRIKRQLAASDKPLNNNPLGRVMQAFYEDRNVDTETLGLKLDEAILKETPELERGLTMIKIIAAVAPLLGLLGTVTGMIVTFQDITLYGTGDPKLMADGISQALITTAQGLTVAIPLVLLHGWLAGRSGSLIQVLDEQSAGIVAEHAERGRG
ncbi:MAG: MotA/TolQ/ExbB proton channel family protein [Gammaproteobacteria bacterium]|jgi:biopolymer transport protein ExbB|nr:MotA/TolQ/ExbB proton channel family protein [Gammaproteobacteria bacterium]